ncbi:unnamed protein product, partial [Schistosoma mattheei]
TSEECYLNLARSISNRLDLDRLPGQRSLIQVPKIERETVRKERQKTIELLSQRIEILKNQFQHKENLLTEALADAKGEQLDQFINELRSKETEIQLLRQSLDRTREALLNEQRSVAAFKKSREQRQRKAIQEKLKRKDYEIDTLKNQLEERDKKLQLLSDQTMKMRMQMVNQGSNRMFRAMRNAVNEIRMNKHSLASLLKQSLELIAYVLFGLTRL